MSNPSDQQVDDPTVIVDAGKPEQAGEAEEYGSAADRVARTAGAGPAHASVQPLSVPEAFELLAGSVAVMEGRGALTTAAGVSALMKKERPDFNVRTLGYPSFRRFIEAASAQGFVDVAWAPSGSDLILRTPSQISPTQVHNFHSSRPPLPSASYGRTRRIRPDVWRAFTASDAEGHFLFDRRSSATSFRSGPPVEDSTDPLVPILPVSTAEKVEWMRSFADHQADPEVRERLLAALESDASGERFRGAASESETLIRRWSRHYRNQVLGRIDAWAAANGVPSSSVEVRPEEYRAPASEYVVSPGRPAGQQVPAGTGGVITGSDLVDLQRLRALVCRAVNEMPLAELLRLPIPVEYTLLRQ